MICRYRFALTDPAGGHIPTGRAYALYSALLELLPEEVREALHEQGETPVSQFLTWERESGRTVWSVSVLDGELAELLEAVLSDLREVRLHTGTLAVSPIDTQKADGAAELIALAQDAPFPRRTTLRLLSPAAFRQNGSYVIVPQERLILQSLWMKWNVAFPDYLLADEDAFQMMLGGLRLTDYDLRTRRYPLKGAFVPGFQGTVTLESRMPEPLFQIWNLLLHFSAFSGVGVKTALGMGGVVPLVNDR